MARIHFPDDLVQAQRDWNTTYAALALSRPHNITALRRRLLALSATLWWHPFWATAPGGAPAAREQLRRLARTTEHEKQAQAA